MTEVFDLGASEFDYIVVGSGSAGSVVAARLSEHPELRVLLLEAGPASIPQAAMDPRVWPAALQTAVDWNYTTTPLRGLGGRTVAEPRGRMLGGSSSLNGMLYVRGHPSDFDRWAEMGAVGWGWTDVVPHFQKLEDCVDDDDAGLGHGGPLHVSNAARHGPHPASLAFVEACVAAGFPRARNWNGPGADAMSGADLFRLNVRDGRRHGAAQAYLEPALGRPNLTLVTEALATGLTFEGTRCTGVDYLLSGKARSARATREVIVAGGPIESAKLLMLSGVGPAAQLRMHGIAVRADLPGVGANLHDHVLMPVVYALARKTTEATQVAFEAGLLFRSDGDSGAPDSQLIFGVSAFGEFGAGPPSAFTIVTALTRPEARGTVRLLGADPLTPPVVDPDLLGEQADADRMVAAARVAARVFGTAPLADWVGVRRTPPGPIDEAAVRAHAQSQWHVVGTCRMGRADDALAVLDPELRVRGVDALRVIDSSAFPAVPSANSQAATIMLAERGADLVKQAIGVSPRESAIRLEETA